MTKIREGYKETEIGVIPEEWEVAKLGDVSEIVSGGTPKTNVEEYWDGGNVFWATPTDITNNRSKYISLTGRLITETGLKNSSANLLPIGSVLMTSRATIGEKCINLVPMSTNQGFKSFICKNILNNEFLYYYIDIIKNELLLNSSGSTFLEISKAKTENIKIALPLLPEQQRIAEILSTTDSHIEKLDKTIDDYQLLKKGMMKKLLTEGIGHTEFKETEIGRIPEEWEVVKLSEITSLITKGTTPSTYGYNFIESGVNFIKVENITPTGYIDKESTPKISDECNSKLSRSKILESDILVSIAGTIGRSAIVDNSYLPANINQALAIVRLKDSYKVDVKYINYTFSSSYFMSYITSIKTVGAQPNMSLKQLNDNLIALPNIDEQKKIAEVLENIKIPLNLMQQNLDDYKLLKKSLMEKLLTGKIRVNEFKGG